MWNYEKRLQFPIDIKTPNAEIAKIIITQYGGPDGELGASMRYLSQRYTIPYKEVAGLLTDIGTEEQKRHPPELLLFTRAFVCLIPRILSKGEHFLL